MERLLQFENEFLRAQTKVNICHDEEAIVEKDNALLEHSFGPGAFTKIWLTQEGWETLHTYPEYESAVHTETCLALLE